MSEHHFQAALPVAFDACAVATGSTPPATARDQRIATEAEMKPPMKARATAPLAAIAATFGVVHQVADHAHPRPRRCNWRRPWTELTVTLSGSDAEAIAALSATPAR